MNKKNIVFFATLILSPILFLSTAHADQELAAKFYVSEGKKEFKAKEYDKAIIDFNKALLAQPDNEEALMYLKMLGFGGKATQQREQEPAAKVDEKSVDETPVAYKETLSEGSSAKKKKAPEKKTPANKKKTLAQKPIKKDKKAPAQKPPAETVAAKEKNNDAVISQTAEDVAKQGLADDAVDDQIAKVETQIAKQEAEDLDRLRAQAAEEEKAALRELHGEEVVKTSSATTAPKSAATASLSSSKKTNIDLKKDMPAQSRAAALVDQLHEKTVQKETELKQKINDQAAKKIEKVHAQFAVKPIPEKVKTVFRDIDNDGVAEAISVNESRAIEKIETEAKKEKQAGIKKIEKQAAQDEKAALMKLRAQVKKEEKAHANVKAGDVVSSVNDSANDAALTEDQLPAKEVAAEVDLDTSAAETQDADISKKEAAVVSDMRDDLSQKEKDLQTKYAKKKLLRISEAEKKSKPQVQEEKAAISDAEAEAIASQKSAAELISDNSQSVPVGTPKSVQAQNVVLKKKLSQVVEMSQKDQVVIKDLETNAQKQDEKVGVLENDLRDTRTNLDSKATMLKDKEEKLKDLSQRIATMESDVNSKQYDFKDKQIEYEKKLKAIEEEFGNYKSERANTEEQLKDQLKTLKDALAKKIAELNAAQEKLIFTENKLKISEEKYAETTKQYDEVKNTLKDLEMRLGSLQQLETPPKDEAPLVAVDPGNLPAPKNQNELMYQQWIKRHDKLIKRLKDKLLWARDQMEFLGQYDIKLSDQKMAALKEQLAEVKKQLSVKNIPAGHSAEDFALMEGRFKDAQDRLDMVQKILSEKDEQVKELEKQLNQALSAF